MRFEGQPEPMPAARMLFSLDPSAQLNHGAFGAVPIPVQRRHAELRAELEQNPARFFTDGLVARVAGARTELASFLGADPLRTSLVANATAGCAVVLNSVSLRPGQQIVTTSHGYGAVDWAIARACTQTGVQHRVVTLPLSASAEQIVTALCDAAADGDTALVVIDHISSPTAMVMPVAAVAARMREAGIPLLIDGAHAPGQLDLRIDEIGADFYVGNLHKWAYAPRGTGILTVAERWREHIQPVVVSWMQPDGFPVNVESQGTLDYTGWLAAPVGADLLTTLGAARIRSHNAALVRYGQQVVADALGVPDERLPHVSEQVSMRLIPVGIPATLAGADALRERVRVELNTEISVNAWSGSLHLRLCGQVYNTPREYEHLAAGLAALLS